MFLPILHHWHFDAHRKRIRDQKGLWVTSFFRQLGFALISIFSVIFIFQMGDKYFLSGGTVNGIGFLLLYLVSLFGMIALLIVPIASLSIRRIGYRRSIVASLLFTSWVIYPPLSSS